MITKALIFVHGMIYRPTPVGHVGEFIFKAIDDGTCRFSPTRLSIH